MDRTSIPADWLPHFTYKDYEQWKGDWELIRGFPYAMSTAANRRHQYVAAQFVFTVIEQLKKNTSNCPCEVLYESDWIIGDQTVVRPDVMIICNTPPSDFVRTPPVLVLEIFSAGTRMKDRNVKFNLYQSNGVKYYLMADPEKNSIEIFKLKNNRYQEHQNSSFELTDSCIIDLNLQLIW
jgi:Uma2 family endonuclease